MFIFYMQVHWESLETRVKFLVRPNTLIIKDNVCLNMTLILSMFLIKTHALIIPLKWKLVKIPTDLKSFPLHMSLWRHVVLIDYTPKLAHPPPQVLGWATVLLMQVNGWLQFWQLATSVVMNAILNTRATVFMSQHHTVQLMACNSRVGLGGHTITELGWLVLKVRYGSLVCLKTIEATSSIRGRRICANNNLLLEYSFAERRSFDTCVKLYLNQYLYCGVGYRGSSFKEVHKLIITYFLTTTHSLGLVIFFQSDSQIGDFFFLYFPPPPVPEMWFFSRYRPTATNTVFTKP